MTWSDEIFEDFRRGEIKSFYDYIYPDILVYATNLLRGQHAFKAEDCVQDAIEASYLKRREFLSSGQWKAFIITCIRNRAISIMRHNEASENYILNFDHTNHISNDILNDYIELETRNRLYNAIDFLPADLKQIFFLSFEEGLKNPEIAKKLNIAEITVKKRKARLLERLRKMLSSENYMWLMAHILP